MTVKEYLSQIRRLDRLINNLIRERNNLRMNALGNNSPRLVADKVQTSVGKGAMSECVDGYVDIENELTAMLGKYRKMRWRIVREINSLPDPRHVELLYLKYVEGRCLEDVACIMRKPSGEIYNYEYIKRLHGWALESFLKKYPNVTEMSP